MCQVSNSSLYVGWKVSRGDKYPVRGSLTVNSNSLPKIVYKVQKLGNASKHNAERQSGRQHS